MHSLPALTRAACEEIAIGHRCGLTDVAQRRAQSDRATTAAGLVQTD